MDRFSQAWDAHYPTISKSWYKNWDNLIALFDYPYEIRRIIYATNAILYRPITENSYAISFLMPYICPQKPEMALIHSPWRLRRSFNVRFKKSKLRFPTAAAILLQWHTGRDRSFPPTIRKMRLFSRPTFPVGCFTQCMKK